MKGLLLFVAGLLLGANLVYFWSGRQCAPAPPAPSINVAPEARPAERASAAAAEQAAASPLAAPAPAPAPAVAPPATDAAPASGLANLLVPVAGITPAQLRDTFTETRGTDRVHEAMDILAPRGTEVYAATDGTVAKLFESKQGGTTLYQFEPGGQYALYYAHLDRYAPGIAEGMALRRGQLLGYVGSTGNADPAAPHLHFAIFQLGPERKWWKGTPVNPYPLLNPPR